MKPIFSDEGLTSTSANHIANLAKEFVKNLQKELEQVHFVSREIALIGQPKTTLSIGLSNVSNIKQAIDNIAKANSLIAWLRESIKTKEAMINNIVIDLDAPERPELLGEKTENDYYDTLNIKERNRYFELLAIVSTYGKFIHPDGSLSEARTELMNAISTPCKTNGSGRDTVITYFTPSISRNTVDELFFELQSYYRSCQAELNKMKHEKEQWLLLQNSEIADKNKAMMEDYRLKYQIFETEKQKQLNAERDRISKLKIVIPDSLKAIFKVISELGK